MIFCTTRESNTPSSSTHNSEELSSTANRQPAEGLHPGSVTPSGEKDPHLHLSGKSEIFMQPEEPLHLPLLSAQQP